MLETHLRWIRLGLKISWFPFTCPPPPPAPALLSTLGSTIEFLLGRKEWCRVVMSSIWVPNLSGPWSTHIQNFTTIHVICRQRCHYFKAVSHSNMLRTYQCQAQGRWGGGFGQPMGIWLWCISPGWGFWSDIMHLIFQFYIVEEKWTICFC